MLVAGGGGGVVGSGNRPKSLAVYTARVATEAIGASGLEVRLVVQCARVHVCAVYSFPGSSCTDMTDTKKYTHEYYKLRRLTNDIDPEIRRISVSFARARGYVLSIGEVDDGFGVI